MGDRIRAERERAGISQGELGKLVGVSQQSVAKWEAGGNVSAKRLEAISDVLQIPVAALLGEARATTVLTRQEEERLDLVVSTVMSDWSEVADAAEALQELVTKARTSGQPSVDVILQVAYEMRESLSRGSRSAMTLKRALAEFDDPRVATLAEKFEQADPAPMLEKLERLIDQLHGLPRVPLRAAASDADADEQTVDPARSPRGDAPADQET